MSLVTGLVSRWAKLPAPPFPTLRVERDLTITTADGAVLLADRCWPVDRPDAPIVLVRTPYGRHRFELFTDVIAAHGYQVVTVSCRGTFGSGGTWEPFFREAEDGRDTLAWLADQPWFVPAVYTFGPSYLGQTQWAVAADPSPWLKGMCIGISCSSFRDLVYTHDRFSWSSRPRGPRPWSTRRMVSPRSCGDGSAVSGGRPRRPGCCRSARWTGRWSDTSCPTTPTG